MSDFTYQELINEIPKLVAINSASEVKINQLEQKLKIAVEALEKIEIYYEEPHASDTAEQALEKINDMSDI